MPRRHRSARGRGAPDPVRPPTGVVPEWALAEGYDVYSSTRGPYRCPGCEQLIREGTVHFVVISEGDLEGRRHWHQACWRTELRRTGRAR